MQSAVARIEQELAPGERVLWTGQPKRGVRFTSADIFLIPFGIVWLGFSIFWTVMAFRIPEAVGIRALSVLFPLFGIPFILVGLYLTVGRFWWDARRRAGTFYAITNQRILALTPRRRDRIASLDVQQLDTFNVTEDRDGTGTIVFTPSNIRSFERIEGVREVESILRRSVESARGSTHA